MKNFVIVATLLCAAFSGLSFAEGGSDRLIERANARNQEATAQNEKLQYDNQYTVQSAKNSSNQIS
jgi:hypothetical protein